MSFPWITNTMTKSDRKNVTSMMPLPLLKDRSSIAPPLSSFNSNSNHTPFPSYDEQQVKKDRTLSKDVLQSGLTIMQLAISEPQELTSLALYSIALNKFISAGPMTDKTTGQKDQFSPSEHHEESGLLFYNNHQVNDLSKENSIWSQFLLSLLDLSTLIMMMIHKTPLPGVISRMIAILYQCVVYLDTKSQLVHLLCQKSSYFLHWLVYSCQQYELLRYLIQIVYLILMSILHTDKTCMEEEEEEEDDE